MVGATSVVFEPVKEESLNGYGSTPFDKLRD